VIDADSQLIAIIPARLHSVRFPGKVLANETGRPLIRHVYDAARAAPGISRVVVAADDERVAEAVGAFGGECVLTSPSHENGTARIAEACDLLGLPKPAIVVNVQGDEPELEPALIRAAIDAIRKSGAPVATVAVPFGSGEDPANPNIVKVVRRIDGTALYFSRSRIPVDRDGGAPSEARPLRHIGLYVYRREFLSRYAALTPTPLEQAERLEQLRILEHGFPIAVALCTNAGGPGIDTPEQYRDFVQRWRARQPA